jgi:glycosyltransferase involved in cell wall biosynthesis
VRITQKILCLVQKQGIRVIHTNSLLDTSAACAIKALIPGLAVIWQEHGLHYRWHSRKLIRWLLRHVTCVVTPSQMRLKQLISEGLDPSRGEFLPHGTDFHFGALETSPPKVVRDQQPLRVGVVGRMTPLKDFETFLEAARIVARSHPSARFSIIGGPEPDSEPTQRYYQRIRQSAAAPPLAGRVDFHGRVENVSHLLATFDVFVCSSLTESFGIAIIEAMALAKPVVATVVDAVPEIVSEGEFGFLVPARNAQAMAEKISCLLDNAPLREAMGRKAQESAREKYDSQRLAARWEDLYERALQAENPRPHPQLSAVGYPY